MINFEEIEIEGFGSLVKPIKFKLNRGKVLNVITGRVGAGKTSIPSALVWGLYGKSLKDKSSITTLDKYQGNKYRGTKVVIKITRENDVYEIIRCKSFKGNLSIDGKKIKGGNNVFVLHNGSLYKPEDGSDGKGKVNNQLVINKLIGYSFELFKNAVVFGQKMKRIIQESGPDKKKVFEEAFDMVFIEEAKVIANDRKKQVQSLINKFENEIELMDEKINSREKLQNKALDNEEFFQKYKEKDIKHYQDKINENIERIKDIKDNQVDDTKITELTHTKISLLKNISSKRNSNSIFLNLERSIKDYQRDINILIKESSKGFEKCKQCGSPIKEKQQEINRKDNIDRRKTLEKNLKNLRDQYMQLEHQDISEDEKLLKNVEIEIGVINSNLKNNAKSKDDIKKLKKKNKTYKKEILAIQNDRLIIRSTFYAKLVKKLIKTRKNYISTTNKLKDQLEITNWLINDPLSNNGLKAYIFNNLMGKINNKLHEYSKILGFEVEFGIDLESHRKDFYQMIERDGVIIPYEDLSGGQQQLVDTSVAFAINDVISDIRPTNILFLDEPFESLGVEEIEIISELIYEKAKEKSVYLITHHQAFSTTNAETIYVKLDENKNTIISD